MEYLVRDGDEIVKTSQERTITEDEQLLALADSDLCEQREQVEWNSRRVLSHDTVSYTHLTLPTKRIV